MLNSKSAITDNTFQILLGEDKVKWDPFWNFLHWICLANQAHNLEDSFTKKLLTYAFQSAPLHYELKQEYDIHPADMCAPVEK